MRILGLYARATTWLLAVGKLPLQTWLGLGQQLLGDAVHLRAMPLGLGLGQGLLGDAVHLRAMPLVEQDKMGWDGMGCHAAGPEIDAPGSKPCRNQISLKADLTLRLTQTLNLTLTLNLILTLSLSLILTLTATLRSSSSP